MENSALNDYIKAWNTSDPIERRSLLEESFDKQGRYVDPHIPAPVTNLDQMEEIIKTFRSRLPHKLYAVQRPELHNYAFRLKWKMEDNGTLLSKGTFVGEFNSDDKISNLICFLDS